MSCVKRWRSATESIAPPTIESSTPGVSTLTMKDELSQACSNGIWSTEAVVATFFDH